VKKVWELSDLAGRSFFSKLEFHLCAEDLMYCPRCSQLQASEDIRFCSRCGLSLSELTEWLDGGPGALANAGHFNRSLSPRRKGMRNAAKVTFFSGILPPLGLGFGMSLNEPVLLFVPLIVFVASLVWILYCRLFMEDGPSFANQMPRPIRTTPNHSLPASPVAVDTRRAITAEMPQPLSVTEYTTNLLRKQ
jgi:hypothetical protein